MTPEKILKRAAELEIGIWVEGNNIKCRGHGPIPPKMVEVLRAHKAELIAYLRSQEEAILANLDPTLFCAACRDQGTETPASLIGPNNTVYCQDHYNLLPSNWQQKAEMERVAEAYRKALPGWTVTVEPRSAPLGQRPHQEKEVHRDYWAEKEARLARTGYHERFKRDAERLMRHIPVWHPDEET